MALQKSLKIGGAFYKGYELIVSSSVGDYVLNIVQTGAAAANSMSIIPDTYGAGDTFKIEHLHTTTGPNLAIIAESIYNPGAGVATLFDFPAMQKLSANEVLRVTYTNTATQALAIHAIVEYVGLTKIA